VTRSRYVEAIEILAAAIESADAAGLGQDSLLATDLRWLLAATKGMAGRHSDAIKSVRDVLSWQLKALPEDHARVARTRLLLLTELSNSTADKKVAEQLEREIEPLRERYGETSMMVAIARSIHANTLRQIGEPAASAAEFEKALPIIRRALGEDHVLVSRNKLNYAAALQAEGSQASLRIAVPLLENVYATTRRLYPRLSPIALHAQSQLSTSLMQLGDWKRGATLLADPTYADAHSISSRGNLRNQLLALEMALGGPVCNDEDAEQEETCAREPLIYSPPVARIRTPTA